MRKDKKKKKKELLILLLVLILVFIAGNVILFLLFPGIFTGNAVKTDVKIISAVDSVYLYPGEIKVGEDKNFIVDVKINSSEEINKVQFELDYSDIIQAIKVEPGDFFKDAFPITSISKGRIIFVSAGAGNQGQGSLFRITFVSKTSGDTDLEINNFKAYNQNREISLETINGKVIVN